MDPADPLLRARDLTRAVRLEYLTVGWNIVEGVVSVSAAMAAGSVVLLGFGIDSFVESASGGILAWRLIAERRGAEPDAVERIERRALKLVSASLIALAVYIVVDAVVSLVGGSRSESSVVGIVVTAVSLVVMAWLARAKRRLAHRLGSRALEADAFQTTACWWLSLVALVGLALNAALGWWWADPVAAIGAAVFIGREAAEAWNADRCCD